MIEAWANIIGAEISPEVLARLPGAPFGKHIHSKYVPTVWKEDSNGTQVECVICIWFDESISRIGYFKLSDGSCVRVDN